jgi:hypothetical protein
MDETFWALALIPEAKNGEASLVVSCRLYPNIPETKQVPPQRYELTFAHKVTHFGLFVNPSLGCEEPDAAG